MRARMSPFTDMCLFFCGLVVAAAGVVRADGEPGSAAGQDSGSAAAPLVPRLHEQRPGREGTQEASQGGSMVLWQWFVCKCLRVQ